VHDLIRLLDKRLGTSVPEPIRLAIEGTNDPVILARWLDAAIDVSSYTDFQSVMRQP
jgi:hypothetical protein